MTSELPDQTLTDRFETVARVKLAAVMEVYHQLEAKPAEIGDKALNLRHATSKTVLTHIVLLRKLLGEDVPPVAGGTRTYDVSELEAMLAEVRQARDGESRDD